MIDARPFNAASRIGARAILSPEELTTLGLTGKEPRDTGGFRMAAHTLFDNAANIAALADYGYDADKLTAERAKVDAWEQADLAQEGAKGSAQQLAQEQEAGFVALNEWVAQYVKIAKVALRGKKQLLDANADRRGGAHDEDGSDESSEEECEVG